MTFGENLRKYRKEAKMTQEELGMRIGCGKSTIAGYERGNRTPDVRKIKELAFALHISTDDLIGLEAKTAPSISDEAETVAREYMSLDFHGKTAVRGLLDEELRRMRELEELEDAEPEREPKIINLFLEPSAAGIASPTVGSEYEPYELKPTDPQGAAFAVRLRGDSMEPYFQDGEIVFVNHDAMRDGDIGIFAVDGGTVCKQYKYDPVLGITYLFALNRARDDTDVVLTRSSGRNLVCQGRVITARRFKLPGE